MLGVCCNWFRTIGDFIRRLVCALSRVVSLLWGFLRILFGWWWQDKDFYCCFLLYCLLATRWQTDFNCRFCPACHVRLDPSFKLLRPKTFAISSAYKWAKTVPNGGGTAWEPTSSNVGRWRLCWQYRSDVDDFRTRDCLYDESRQVRYEGCCSLTAIL